jgi:hypothetical protein
MSSNVATSRTQVRIRIYIITLVKLPAKPLRGVQKGFSAHKPEI